MGGSHSDSGMKRTVYKYWYAGAWTDMPTEARIVHVDGETETLWAEVDPEAERTKRTFRVFGTGHLLPDGAVHVYTWESGRFVWHLYEVESGPAIDAAMEAENDE